MNLLKFITHIHYKLQQNAETAFFPNDYILEVVNKSLIYIYNYCDWSWTLVVDKVDVNEPTDTFKMHFQIYKPYIFSLDKREYKRTNIPIDFMNYPVKWNSALYWYNTKWDMVKFAKEGKSVLWVYHRWAPQYDKIDPQYTIDIPTDMLAALEMCVLRYLHPGWFEQWAQLSNQYFNMMKEILDRQKKIYWFTLKPEDLRLDRIYSKMKMPFTSFTTLYWF